MFDIVGVEVFVAAHVHARDVTLGGSVRSDECMRGLEQDL